ncbi:MAG: S-layer homology domain-containing protein [Clostridiales bacterium]|nr:S-layer homology domain-containing protein [Clostridiales bacterium]
MKKALSVFLCLLMISGVSSGAFAVDIDTVNNAVTDTAEYLYETLPNPQVGSIGGEWAVIGLARSGADIPEEYYENYYRTVEKYIKDCGGVLHEKKYTEYSRVILALTAVGKNPAEVAGYNLLMPLGDYEKTTYQGVNGSIWALIALDSGNYEIPQNTSAGIQSTREMYVKNILDNQNADGGWALSGDSSDPDVTAMALQALSKYRDYEGVKTATEKALALMSEGQNENGGFSSRNTENSESSAQMIAALCELGISLDDSRFIKNGNTILDNMMTYYENGKGFKHTKDGAANQMATEQCFYALVAVKRFYEGKNSLYSMNDAVSVGISQDVGLSGKNPDVRKMNVVSPGKTFADIQGDSNQSAIEELAERNIINGKSENSFEPKETMTRAEFATIIVKGLGLPATNNVVFSDVTSNDWFYSFAGTAYEYGIVSGVSDTEFNPNGTITREEAAAMVARAAKLCGMNTDIEAFAARDILAGFLDYVKASDWAVSALAFCYDNGILPNELMEINPKEAVTRAEIAQMLYNMLSLSKLI